MELIWILLSFGLCDQFPLAPKLSHYKASTVLHRQVSNSNYVVFDAKIIAKITFYRKFMDTDI